MVDAFQQLGYIKLPVDPSQLMEAHGIQTLPYQIAYNPSKSWEDMATLCRCPSGLSFVLSADGQDLRFAACNLQEHPGRVRFTKLHETGHLLRGHLRDSELAEIEANLWAKYAIAPSVLIEELNITTVEEVAQCFGTSKRCAANILKLHLNWQRHRHENQEFDDKILELYWRGKLLEQKGEEAVREIKIQ